LQEGEKKKEEGRTEGWMERRNEERGVLMCGEGRR
jgi:hypothetical protein